MPSQLECHRVRSKDSHPNLFDCSQDPWARPPKMYTTLLPSTLGSPRSMGFRREPTRLVLDYRSNTSHWICFDRTPSWRGEGRGRTLDVAQLDVRDDPQRFDDSAGHLAKPRDPTEDGKSWRCGDPPKRWASNTVPDAWEAAGYHAPVSVQFSREMRAGR